MTDTVYDRNADFYVDFIDRGLGVRSGYVDLLVRVLLDCLGPRLQGARVCDVCCGEGYLGRRLTAEGAHEVVGVDLSASLIEVARRRADSPALTYQVDDAHALASLPDAGFDIAISQMAMMDVADHRRMFAAVRRVLKPGAPFVFSMLHPCFEGRPFHVSDAPPFLLGEDGAPVACVVRRYHTEGQWNSGGDGVRGRMSAYHRTLATYVNDLLAAGFVLERLEEPLAGADASGRGLFAEVPTALVLAARAA